MKIRKGDMVKIISGADKGKSGRVIKVFLDKERIVVEGVHMVKKHTRPTQENPQGAIIEKELSIHVSNAMYLNGQDATKIGIKRSKDGGKKRFSKLTSKDIDWLWILNIYQD